MKLSSNMQLYEYLMLLSNRLKAAGVAQLSEIVTKASRTVRTIPATEFLGESRIALKRVSEMDVGILSPVERSDLEDVLKQLDDALDGR